MAKFRVGQRIKKVRASDRFTIKRCKDEIHRLRAEINRLTRYAEEGEKRAKEMHALEIRIFGGMLGNPKPSLRVASGARTLRRQIIEGEARIAVLEAKIAEIEGRK